MNLFGFGSNIDKNKIPSFVLTGDSCTGKSSFFDRISCPDKRQYKFIKGYKATEGFNLKEITLITNYGEILVHVWDTAGQEKFGDLRSAYVHGADGCIILYDVTERKTKDNVDYWLKYLKTYCKSPPVVAVRGNKKDKIKGTGLLDTVRLRQIVLEKTYNYSNSISNDLISVKNNDGIKETMEWLLSKHYGKRVTLC